MHELSIALAIVDLAIEKLVGRDPERVASVHLKVGLLSGVVPAALRSAFAIVTEQGPLAGADLVVEEVPVTVFCARCDVERAIEFPCLRCPVCGDAAPDVRRGRELEIIALEVESPCTEPLA